MKTDCASCLFNTSDTGVACRLGRYDKYAAEGRVEGTTVNDICNACRNRKYKDERPYENLDEIYKEIEIRYDAVVYYNDKINKPLTAIYDSIQQITKFSIKPKKLHIVISTEQTYVFADLLDGIKNLLKGTGIEYGIHRQLDKTMSVQSMMDRICEYVGATYFLNVIPGLKVNPKIISSLNEKVNFDLHRVMVVDSGNCHESVYHTYAYRGINGNWDGKFIKKFKEKLAEDNLEEGKFIWSTKRLLS